MQKSSSPTDAWADDSSIFVKGKIYTVDFSHEMLSELKKFK